MPNELSTLVRIVAVGPGKWHKGEWWKIGPKKWEWQDSWFEPTVVYPGQTAIIGPYTDLDVGEQILAQQDDIRCIVEA